MWTFKEKIYIKKFGNKYAVCHRYLGVESYVTRMYNINITFGSWENKGHFLFDTFDEAKQRYDRYFEIEREAAKPKGKVVYPW